MADTVLVSRPVRPKDDPLAALIAAVKADVRAGGLTDAEIDAAVAADASETPCVLMSGPHSGRRRSDVADGAVGDGGGQRGQPDPAIRGSDDPASRESAQRIAALSGPAVRPGSGTWADLEAPPPVIPALGSSPRTSSCRDRRVAAPRTLQVVGAGIRRHDDVRRSVLYQRPELLTHASPNHVIPALGSSPRTSSCRGPQVAAPWTLQVVDTGFRRQDGWAGPGQSMSASSAHGRSAGRVPASRSG